MISILMLEATDSYKVEYLLEVDKYTSCDYGHQDNATYHCIGEGDTEDYDETLTEMRSDDDAVVTIASTDLEKQAQEVLRAQEKRELAEMNKKNEKQQKHVQQNPQQHLQQQPQYQQISTDSIDVRDSQATTTTTTVTTTDSSGNTNKGTEKQADSDLPQKQNMLQTNKTTDSHIEKVPRNLHTMNSSAIGLTKKSYLSENSLFFADRESVLVFGGVDPHSPYGVGRNRGLDIYRYLPDVNTWEFMGELPEPRHHHSVGFLKGRVFIVGGADPRDDDIKGKSVVVNTVWSYDPVIRTWFVESPMLMPRKNFGLVVSNGKLYAIGGQDRQGSVLSSVERFDLTTGVWEEIAPLETGRMGIAATKFRDLIWVAGGMTASKKSPLCRNVECYDPQRNVWISYTGLRFPRCFGCLFSMNDTLYLIGGAGRVTERDRTTVSVGAIDIWDIENKQWCLKSEMSIPRHGHSVAYIGPQILIIGGVTTVYMRALSNVECFCCQRGQWIRGISSLPITLSGHGSITLPPASLM